MKQIRIDGFQEKSFGITGIESWKAEIRIENKLYHINNKDKYQQYPVYHYTENSQFDIEIKITNPLNKEEIKSIKKFNTENIIDKRDELFLLISLNAPLFESTLAYKKWTKKGITALNITLTLFFLIILTYSRGLYSFQMLGTLSIIWLLWILIVQFGYVYRYGYFKMYKKVFRNDTENLIGLILINDIRKEEEERW